MAGAQRRGVASAPPGEGSCGGPVELPQPLIHHDVGSPAPRGQVLGLWPLPSLGPSGARVLGTQLADWKSPEGSRTLNLCVKTLDSLDP